MKKLIIMIAVIATLVSCVRKKQTGQDAEKIESARTNPTLACSQNLIAQLKPEASLIEVAYAGEKMKSECQMTEDEVVTEMEKIF